ncbi:MAG: hypothetical protein U0802_07745 [Candidatus Binatia bacterium]
MRALPVAGLAAVLAVAALLRVAVVPAHHAMYVDEPWYAEAACHLARAGQLSVCEETWSGARCTPYAKAVGWPVLLAPLVSFAGRGTTTVGISLNRVLGGVLTVLLVAVAGRRAGVGWWPGLLAAALLSAIHLARHRLVGDRRDQRRRGRRGARRFVRRARLRAPGRRRRGGGGGRGAGPGDGDPPGESLPPALACAAALAAVAAEPPGRRGLVAAAVAVAASAAAAAARRCGA